MVLVFVFSQNRPFRLTAPRVALLVLCLFASWFAYKRPLGINLLAAYKDWVIIVPVIALAFLVNRGRVSPREATTAMRPHRLPSARCHSAALIPCSGPIPSSRPLIHRCSEPSMRTSSATVAASSSSLGRRASSRMQALL